MAKSNSDLKDLQKILDVPENPIDTDRDIFERNAKELKVKFPDDYVAFSTTYGSGTLENEDAGFELHSVCRESYPAIVEHFFKRNGDFREAAETHDVGLGLFPEPGGLLPFGKSDSGTYFCWDTTNKSPNDWPVVVMWEYAHDGFNRQKGDAMSFLHGLLSGKKSGYFWGAKWRPSLPVTFTSEVFSG